MRQIRMIAALLVFVLVFGVFPIQADAEEGRAISFFGDYVDGTVMDVSVPVGKSDGLTVYEGEDEVAFSESNVKITQSTQVLKIETNNSGVYFTASEVGTAKVEVPVGEVIYVINVTVNPLTSRDICIVGEKSDGSCDPLEETMIKNENETYQLKVAFSSGAILAFVDSNTVTNWASSNQDVISVTNAGEMKALTEGTATITGTYKGVSLSQTIEVYEEYGVYVEDYATDSSIYTKQEEYMIGSFIFPYVSKKIVLPEDWGWGFSFEIAEADEQYLKPESLDEWPWIANKVTPGPIEYTVKCTVSEPGEADDVVYEQTYEFVIVDDSKENIERFIDRYYNRFTAAGDKLTLDAKNGVMNIKNIIDSGKEDYVLSESSYDKLNAMLKSLNIINYEVKGNATVEGLEAAVPMDIQKGGIGIDTTAASMTVGFSTETVTTGDTKEANDTFAAEKGYTVVDTQEMLITKTNELDETTTISELNAPVSVTIPFQGTLGENEEVAVLRNHNGQVEELPAEMTEGEVTFQSNLFSTYSIVIKEVKQGGSGTGNNNSTIDKTPVINETGKTTPKTGDYSNVALWSIVTLSAMAMAIGAVCYKKRVL